MSSKGNPFNLLISQMERWETVSITVLSFQEIDVYLPSLWYEFSRKKRTIEKINTKLAIKNGSRENTKTPKVLGICFISCF
jgi:hypothetical protein